MTGESCLLLRDWLVHEIVDGKGSMLSTTVRDGYPDYIRAVQHGRGLE